MSIEKQDQGSDLTASPNPNPLSKPVAQPTEQPPAPIVGEGSDGRPRPGNPNDGTGDDSGREESPTWQGSDPESVDRSDAARAERARDMANRDKTPEADAIHAGPVDAPDTSGAERIAVLVGGPRNGYQARIPAGKTSITVDSDGKRHEYRIGANLPADFGGRLPAQTSPRVYFGYYGPDPDHIRDLRNEYPESPDIIPGGAVIPGPRRDPSIAVDL